MERKNSLYDAKYEKKTESAKKIKYQPGKLE